MPGGFLGVEVFFVVSGYLITSLLLAERRETGGVSLRRFWLRRARRLLPALFVLLAVVVAYSLLFLPDAIDTLKADVVAALTYTSNWWQIVAHQLVLRRGRAARAAEAPVVARDRRAVLSVLAAAADARPAQARPAAHARRR